MRIFSESIFQEYYRKHPLILVDVGASGGLEPHWRSVQKYLHVIGFEPDPREFSNLQKQQNNMVKYLNIGLYQEKMAVTYYLLRKQQTSSMFKPNREFLDKFPEAERFDIMREVKIEVDSLDSQFLINKINTADFIKIDTQGSELFILQGAEKTIKEHVLGLEIEVEFTELYQNQPLFSDVDNFVRKQGFELFDIQMVNWKRKLGKNYHKKRGQLVFGNVLYLRKCKDILRIIDSIPDILEKKSKALKIIAISCIYGYFDYAKEVLVTVAGIFDKAELDVVEKTIVSSVRWESFIPNFKGRGLIAGIFYSLWDIARPLHNKWAMIDRKLGNV